jgi:hypothetical protein
MRTRSRRGHATRRDAFSSEAYGLKPTRGWGGRAELSVWPGAGPRGPTRRTLGWHDHDKGVHTTVAGGSLTVATASLASIMRDQVAVSVTCVDRLYVNGYVPTLQSPGQLVRFCREQVGKPIASPALFHPLHDRFVQAVQTFAVEHEVPFIHFERGQRKDTIAAGYRAHSRVNDGVVFHRRRSGKGDVLQSPQSGGRRQKCLLRLQPPDGRRQPLLFLWCDEQSRVVTERR